MCPITGIPAAMIAFTRDTDVPAPSSFTTSAPLLDEADRRLYRLLVRHLVGAEREVADDDCRCEAAATVRVRNSISST